MKIAPSSAAMNAPARKVPSVRASDVPTRTGAIAAGSVRSRAAMTQMRTIRSRAPWELREVGLALLLVRLAALARLVGAVEQEVRVVRQLLDAGVAVLVGVERRLRQP